MKTFRILAFTALLSLGSTSLEAHAKAPALLSPDGRLEVSYNVDGGLWWSVKWNGHDILMPSRLGIETFPQTLFSNMKVVGQSKINRDETWTPVYGEKSRIRDRYNELAIELESAGRRKTKLLVIFRAYNEGAAVSYLIPAQEGLDKFIIKKELTQFRFSENHECWPVYSAQGTYEKTKLDKVRPRSERPLTVKINEDVYAAVLEARLVDYARMRLSPAGGADFTLQADLDGTVQAKPPFATPWRVVMAAESPGKLLQNNYLILNLNDPCAIKDTSWIKPGKVIREISLTTTGAKQCVDFAKARGIRYVEFDAGWYGRESSYFADARTVDVDPRRSPGPLDLQEVIRYAKERDIGIWLYVNRRHLERQGDELFPLYEKWGIAGVKFGFVRVGSQKWTSWLHRMVRMAAKHRLMVDIHDNYRPTGVSRTWPNLLTQEGVRGNEEMPTAAHNLILPYTRYLAGPADYTICWNDERIKTTHGHQMAAAMVFYSPLQFLYWYDRPAEIEITAAISYLDRLPVEWDETRVLDGEIGGFIVMARRKGDEWWLAALNGGKAREFEIGLDFLDPGREYRAYVYEDSEVGPKGWGIKMEELKVGRGSIIKAACRQSGGVAARIEPLR